MAAQTCQEIEERQLALEGIFLSFLQSIFSRVAAWMAMVGYRDVEHSPCHRQQSFALSRNRAAFIGHRAADAREGIYYGHTDENFPIGRAI